MKHIADLKDPNDTFGRSYREVNQEKKHSICVGTLVELYDGVRLWVVHHSRDCDGTPLYYLCADKSDTEKRQNNFRNLNWIGGYSEESLKVIEI